MATDWIKRSNSDFDGQARGFSNVLVAHAESYGIDPADAALLAAEFADFDAKYRAVLLPSTRTSIAVMERDSARQTLAAHMRLIAMRIRANPAVTGEMRVNLGMTVEGGAATALSTPPLSEPCILVGRFVSNWLTLTLRDSGSSTRGVPRGCTGAQIFMYVGRATNTPPDITKWQLVGTTSKAKTTIKLPFQPPGTCITLAARWYNSRGAGPNSRTVEVWTGPMFQMPALVAA